MSKAADSSKRFSSCYCPIKNQSCIEWSRSVPIL